MQRTLVAITFSLALSLGAPCARADLACHEGGLVSTSTAGTATVTISAYGCREFPSATYTVQVGGVDRFTIANVSGGGVVRVSDTGRTVLVAEAESLRADQQSFTVFRDGRRFGVYPIAALLGSGARAVTEGRYVSVEIRSVHLVVTDLDGTQLLRQHLARLEHNDRAAS